MSALRRVLAPTKPAEPMTGDRFDALLLHALPGRRFREVRRRIRRWADEYAARMVEQHAGPPEHNWTLPQRARQGHQ